MDAGWRTAGPATGGSHCAGKRRGDENNTAERRALGPEPFAASDATLEWTGSKLKAVGLRYLIGAHCTGIDAVYKLRTLLGLSRKTAVVDAVGASFTLGAGITALLLGPVMLVPRR